MTFRPKCGRSLFYAKDADKIFRNDLSEKGRFCYNSFKRKINNIFQKNRFAYVFNDHYYIRADL